MFKNKSAVEQTVVYSNELHMYNGVPKDHVNYVTSAEFHTRTTIVWQMLVQGMMLIAPKFDF